MLDKGTVLNGKYSVITTLGTGGMGAVYLARDVDGRYCAVKEQFLTGINRKIVFSEIDILSKLKHPSLPALIDTFAENETQFIVMEYVEGVSLKEVLEKEGRIGEDRVRKWALELAEILRYLHGLDNPIVYRDLKPANIMLDPEGHIHLIDFGIAQEYGEETNDSNKFSAKTKGYAAPEQYDKRYGADVRTDIYALGVTLHYLLSGKNPNEPPFVFQRLRKFDKHISRAMEELVNTCLQPRPTQRYSTAEELKQALLKLDERDKDIIASDRKRAILTGTVIVLIAVLLAGVFFALYIKQGKRTDKYNELILTAVEYSDNGKVNKAIDTIEEAIAMEPAVETAYLQKAEILRSDGRYDECLEYLSAEILDRFPDIYDNKEFLELMINIYEEIGKPELAKPYKKILDDLE